MIKIHLRKKRLPRKCGKRPGRRARACRIRLEQTSAPGRAGAIDHWGEDVAEQRRAFVRVRAEVGRATDELECYPIGRSNWGELRRQKRFLQHHLEEELQKLAQFEVFVPLIEQGYSKDRASKQVHNRASCPTEQETAPEVDSALESQVEPTLLSASDAEQTPAPELSPKAWRASLFAELLALFGWESQRLNKNSRGLANKAAILLQESGIRPEQLPRRKRAL